MLLSSPTSDLARIALGTSSLGAGTVEGSPQDDAAILTAIALLRREDALVDTANIYAGGRSEEVLGAALATFDADERRAASARIVTKVDREPETGRFDGDRVRRSAEESLGRLGVDRVPLLHLHDPYILSFDEAMASGGAVETLVGLRDEGVAERIGIAAGPVPLLRRYVDTGVFDAVLCHNRWTPVDRSAESLYLAAKAQGMTVFNAAPYGGGLLARGAIPGATYEYRPASDDLLAWTRQLEGICADFEVPLTAVALHFSLRSSLVDHTVVGVSSPSRLDALVALRDLAIPDELWAAMQELAPAPTPINDTAYGDAQ